METNLRLYPWYQACRNLLFWLPVFFLYFSSVLPLDDVLLLEALYYLGVVVLEVPSGYFSDHVGRRVTLLIAATLWGGACAVFALTSSFGAFALAQLMLAGGMAFNSGTDSALLFDSLAGLGRDAEIGRHEARAQVYAFGALALSAVVGGLLASVDLRWAYGLSAVGGAGAFLLARAFTEPTRHGARAEPPLQQCVAVLACVRQPVLAWIFTFAVGMTVLNHVPYEFFQPYLEFLLGEGGGSPAGEASQGGPTLTPAVSGLLVGAMMLVSSYASRYAMPLRDRLGATGALLTTMALQLLVIAVMGAVLHVAVVALILLRSVPGALMTPIMNATIHPRLVSGLRATYLSTQSLVGRLAFATSLAGASWVVGGEGEISRASMSTLLLGFAGPGALVLVVLWATAPGVARRLAQEQTSGDG